MQTVAAFSPDLQPPTFEVCPVGVSDAILGARSYLDLDFDFSGRYSLRGPNQDRVRDLFNPSLTSALISFTPEDHWHIERAGTTLIFYRVGVAVRGKELPAFLQQTSSVARTFCDVGRAQESEGITLARRRQCLRFRPGN